MRMLNGNVLTTLDKEESTKTVGGIILPTSDKTYKVVDIVEPDADNEVKKGSTVYLPKHSGVEVEIEGTKYLIVNKREIILIL